VRKTVLSTLFVALLLGVCGVCPAQAASPADLKPVAVLSLPSYDEAAEDFQFAAGLCDQPELTGKLQAIAKAVGQGIALVGLDKDRPMGAVVQMDGDQPSGYVFLPVMDIDQLHAVVKPLVAEITQLDDGLYKVVGKEEPKTMYVKTSPAGWLFMSEKREALAATPDDPRELIGGLSEKYDVAVRLNVANLPEHQRQRLIAKLKEDTLRELQRKPGEGDQEYTVRKIVTEGLLGAVVCGMKELDQITLGCSLDRYAENALVELSVTAVEGTPTAEKLARLCQTKTSFAGFRLPGAVLTGNWTCGHCLGEAAELDTVCDAVRSKAFAEIDSKVHVEHRAKAAKEFLGGLLEVAEETVASGKVDGAVALVLKPEAATLVVGKYVADGDKLEETLKILVDAVRQQRPGFVDQVLTPNADECQGVRLHLVSIPVPYNAPHRDKVVQLIGENLDIVVGIGQQSFYLSLGRDAMKVLKQAIEKSAAAGDQPVAPLEVTVSLSELANFVAEMGKEQDRAKAKQALAVLQRSGGKDHLRLVASPIERGVKYRLELEKGVLELIAAMHKI
jgi:hypothetical protein